MNRLCILLLVLWVHLLPCAFADGIDEKHWPTNQLYSTNPTNVIMALLHPLLTVTNIPQSALRLVEIAETNSDSAFLSLILISSAVDRLKEMGSNATNALPYLEKTATNEIAPQNLRMSCLTAIFNISAGSAEARRILDLTLRGPQNEMYNLALNHLYNGPFYPAASNFIPVLIEQLANGPTWDQRRTIRALANIVGAQHSANVAKVIRAQLNSSVAANRAEAAAGLGVIRGWQTGDPIKLGELLSDSNAEVRASAIQTLMVMGTNAAPALSSLQRAATSSDSSIANSARQILLRLEP